MLVSNLFVATVATVATLFERRRKASTTWVVVVVEVPALVAVGLVFVLLSISSFWLGMMAYEGVMGMVIV
jgi:hypothetical protein